MPEFVEKEKYQGLFNGKEVKFNRVWSNYRFSDEECEALLAGEEICIKPTSKKTGKPYDCYGRLEEQMFTSNDGKQIKFYGFKPDFNRIPDQFNGHIFSEEEKKALKDGDTLYCVDLFSQKTGKNYSAYLRYDKDKGMQMAFQNDEE